MNHDGCPEGFASLVLWKRLFLLACAGFILIATAFHAAMVVSCNVPDSAVRDDVGETLDRYRGPWLNQGWSLFAPNPPHVNLIIRARGRTSSGAVSGWYDVTQYFIDAMHGNPLTPTRAIFEGLSHSAPAVLQSGHDDVVAKSIIYRTASMVLENLSEQKRFASIDIRIDRIAIAHFGQLPNALSRKETDLGWKPTAEM